MKRETKDGEIQIHIPHCEAPKERWVRPIELALADDDQEVYVSCLYLTAGQAAALGGALIAAASTVATLDWEESIMTFAAPVKFEGQTDM